jgi:hypothetical protein
LIPLVCDFILILQFYFYPLCFVPLVRSPHLIFLFLILSLLCPIRSHLRFSFYLPILYHLQKLITIDNILHHFFVCILSCCVLWNIAPNRMAMKKLYHFGIISVSVISFIVYSDMPFFMKSLDHRVQTTIDTAPTSKKQLTRLTGKVIRLYFIVES